MSWPWPIPPAPIIVEKKVWNVMEGKTMGVLRGDKVPLGDNRSATCGKLYLRQ